jgi:hypothetical protein
MIRILRLAVVCAALASPSHASDDNRDRNALLGEAARTIRAIWKEWMEKGELVHDRLRPDQQAGYEGDWSGSFTEDDESEPTKIGILLRPDGTWASKTLRPDMANGHWYLHDSMILLFEAPLSSEADLAFAIISRERKVLLLHADSPTGTVELHKSNTK